VKKKLEIHRNKTFYWSISNNFVEFSTWGYQAQAAKDAKRENGPQVCCVPLRWDDAAN
jgi:hypothetical protein